MVLAKRYINVMFAAGRARNPKDAVNIWRGRPCMPTSWLAFAGTKRINSVPGDGNSQKDRKKVERQDDSLKRLETP